MSGSGDTRSPIFGCLAAAPIFAIEPLVGVRIEVREHAGCRVAVVLRNGQLAVVAPMPARKA